MCNGVVKLHFYGIARDNSRMVHKTAKAFETAHYYVEPDIYKPFPGEYKRRMRTHDNKIWKRDLGKFYDGYVVYAEPNDEAAREVLRLHYKVQLITALPKAEYCETVLKGLEE